jgi:phosphoribosylformimino-5-aminoimidazole carboxamide ribotide isomerase
MIVIPAIDLKDGKCVRLRQGRMDSSTVFNDEPSAQAREWEELGAARIHVVDLNGSVDGKPINLQTVREIVKAVGVPVQLGGGIRDEKTVETYLDIGVNSVILGTIAVKNPDRVMKVMESVPGKVAIGIDARSGNVAVEGWTESTEIRATDLAARFEGASPVAFIYTDIDRDGMMKGPNIPATKEFASSTSIPVVLSGGVSSYSDITAALPLEKDGVMGIIIGRALYEGSINLKEAIRLAEKRDVS